MELNATHLRCELELDFEACVVRGWVEHQLDRAASDGDEFIVQTRDLEIEAVTL